jgi:hypothetical protein
LAQFDPPIIPDRAPRHGQYGDADSLPAPIATSGSSSATPISPGRALPVGAETGSELLVGANREELIQGMLPSVRLAYLAFMYAESKAARRLEDREAYDLLNEEGIPSGAGDRGELTEYQLPTFETWSRQLRKAREALGEQKYTRRAGRPTGRSIVRGSQVEQQQDADL